ncbi:MAG: hypothetical protein MUE53_04540 [Chitinophagales bacterium]|jgi:hypothetical protein|nr:hypothetical protein [Chitinophagales bacterium]
MDYTKKNWFALISIFLSLSLNAQRIELPKDCPTELAREILNITNTDTSNTKEKILTISKKMDFPFASLDEIGDSISFYLGPKIKFFQIISHKGKSSGPYKAYHEELHKILLDLPSSEVNHLFRIQTDTLVDSILIVSFPKVNRIALSAAQSIDLNFIQKMLYLDMPQNKEISSIRHTLQRYKLAQIQEPIGYETRDSLNFMSINLKPYAFNQFSAIFGLYNDEKQQINYTFDLSLTAHNLLKRGIVQHITWQKLINDNQFLKLKTTIPHIFHPRATIAFALNFDRFSSDFYRLEVGLSPEFLLPNKWMISLDYNHKLMRTLNLDTSFLQTNILPNNVNFNYNQIGVNLGFSNLSPEINNLEGFELNFSSHLIIRNIVKQTEITEYRERFQKSFEFLYDQIDLETFLYKFSIQITKNTKLARYFGLEHRLNSKLIFSEDFLRGESIFIGGFHGPRGFADLSIGTDKYAMLQQSIVFLPVEVLALKLFQDFSLINTIDNLKSITFAPFLSIGIGMELKTKQQRLSFFIAQNLLGEQVDFSNAKIHVRFASLF